MRFKTVYDNKRRRKLNLNKSYKIIKYRKKIKHLKETDTITESILTAYRKLEE